MQENDFSRSTARQSSPGLTGSTVRLDGVQKSFRGLRVLGRVSLNVSEHSIVAIVGPSGSGKSTILNIIAQILPADAGRLEMNSHLSFGAGLNYMMQDSVLLPWRTLWQNALLAAEVVDSESDTAKDRCQVLFSQLNLYQARNVLPDEASGGMLRRAALARALLTQPRLLLLDEPFAGLDFDIKLRAQRVLLREYASTAMSIVLVTHDIEDAIVLADRVVVLSEKPTVVKTEFEIDRGADDRDPFRSRASAWFTTQFRRAVKELRYLRD